MTAPDLTDYRVIHETLRIAPHRIAAALAAFDGDRAQATALAKYWAGYAGEVLAHHRIEDEIFFPRLFERVPHAAEHHEQVESDHHRLDELMEACSQALAEVATSATTQAAAAAASVVLELASHMDRHLDFEDDELVPQLGIHFTADEYQAMQTAAQKSIGLGKQAAFTVPFVLHWAAPADKGLLLAEAPLAFRILFAVTRRGHARLVSRALGTAAVREGALQ